MYLKVLKTAFANHISHTYKKGTAPVHVPGRGCRQRTGLSPQHRAPARPGAAEAAPELPRTEGSCSVPGPLLCPDAQARTAGAAKEQRAGNKGCSPPRAESNQAFPHGRDGTEQLPSGHPHPHSSPGAGMWHPGQTVHGPFSL